MNDPKRIDKIEQNVERLSQAEKNHDFVIRDSSVKIGLAEGLAEVTYREFTQLKIDIVQIRAELHELRASADQHSENTHKKLDTQESMTKENGELLKEHSQRFDKIEATMATKDDIVGIKATQEKILQLLQQRSGE